jgi:IclR helix-turn-helix domain
VNRLPDVVRSASRTIDVRELLPDRSRGLALLEIGEELGVAKSSAHSLVATLLARSVPRLNQDGRRSVYRLGFAHAPSAFRTALVWSADLRLGLRRGVIGSGPEEGPAWFQRLVDGDPAAKVLLRPPGATPEVVA